MQQQYLQALGMSSIPMLMAQLILTLLYPDIKSFKNSVDPDQLASQKLADHDQRCFPPCMYILAYNLNPSSLTGESRNDNIHHNKDQERYCKLKCLKSPNMFTLFILTWFITVRLLTVTNVPVYIKFDFITT